MVRSLSLVFRIDPETKALLEAAAEKDGRSISSLLYVIVREWLHAKGYLKD